MMTRLELQVTEQRGGRLVTHEVVFSDRQSLLKAFPSLPPSVPTLACIYVDDSTLVYLMSDGHNYHLSLWKSSEEWGILVNPKPTAEYCNVGWDTYAGWATNTDFAVAQRAIQHYTTEGVVIDDVEWSWEMA